MTSPQVRLFGAPEFRGNGAHSKQLEDRTVGRLLALLCIHADRDMTRKVILRLLWPYEDGVPLNRVAVALYHLRRMIQSTGVDPDPILITTRTTIRLNLGYIQIDLSEFLHIISRARNTESTDARRRAYTQAVNLYRAAFLGETQESWAVTMRLKTQADFQEAVSWLANDALQTGSDARAQEILTSAILRDPISISSCETIVMWMAEHGQLRSALDALDSVITAITSTGKTPPRRLIELAQSWRSRLETMAREERVVCILAADNIRSASFASTVLARDGRHGRNPDFALFPTPATALGAASEMLSDSRKARIVITLAVMDASDQLPPSIRPVLRGLPKGSLFCSNTVKPLLAETTDAVIMTASVVEKWHEVSYSDSPPA